MRRGSVLGTALLLLSFLTISGCAAGTTSSEDCQSRIRVGDALFTGYGSTQRAATPLGEADQAECHDVGEDAAGSVFPDDPTRVRTWQFAGYPASDVLGVRHDEDSFEVYVSEALPPDERDRVLEEVTGPAS